MLPYTTAAKACLQWIFATFKLKDSLANYLAFIKDLGPLLSPSQMKKLECVIFFIDVEKQIKVFRQSH
jgi:hypothetical protein